MKLEYCKDCIYFGNFIALGLGPRCLYHTDPSGVTINKMPIISQVENCENKSVNYKNRQSVQYK